MWNGLVGKFGYLSGTTGTATVPEGAVVTQLIAIGAGSFTIFGGASITTVEGVATKLQFNHELCVSRNGAKDIVFTGTDSYYVEYVKPGA